MKMTIDQLIVRLKEVREDIGSDVTVVFYDSDAAFTDKNICAEFFVEPAGHFVAFWDSTKNYSLQIPITSTEISNGF